MFALVLVGCASGNTEEGSSLPDMSAVQSEQVTDSGVLVLRVNPEIAIKYGEQGIVTDVRGRNDEGNAIVENYQDFTGKNSDEVLKELITLIGEAGYFVEEVEGEPKRIELELESGSVLPEDEFLEKMTTNAQSAVSQFNADTNDSKNEQTEQANQTNQEDTQETKEITMEDAKAIALNHAGKNAADVRFDDLEFDIDDGVPHFEIEFDVGLNEYDYDIHAETGQIIEYDHEVKKSPNKENTANKEISKDEAIEIALNHAGLSRSEVHFDDVELEDEDGLKEWEIEFDHSNWEYEYDIDAKTGNILDFEKDHDD